MKEEEKKSVCVGEAHIELTVVNYSMKINGSFTKVPNQIVSAVSEAIERYMPYNTRIKKCGNTTTLIFVDCVGCHITLDDLQTRVSMMHTAMTKVGDVIVALSSLHSLSKNYDGELRKREESANKANDSDNE